MPKSTVVGAVVQGLELSVCCMRLSQDYKIQGISKP